MSRALLHVGVHKTGSTSLQIALEQNRRRLETDGCALLPKDFPGTAPPAWGLKSGAAVAFHLQSRCRRLTRSASCNGNAHPTLNESLAELHGGLGAPGRFANPEIWRFFTGFLLRSHANQSDVAISSEEFDQPTVDVPLLAAALRPFETTVVVVHRPFVDWLVSYHAEYHLHYTREAALSGRVTLPPPALEDFLTHDFIIRQASSEGTSSLPVHQRFSRYFDNVLMFELSPTFHEDLVCHVLKAPHTCASIKRARPVVVNAKGSRAEERMASRDEKRLNSTVCMDTATKRLLWALSVSIETRVRQLLTRARPSWPIGSNAASSIESGVALSFKRSGLRLCEAS